MGASNFYTEFWNSLIMQIYANLFKINENATSPLFRSGFLFCLFYLIGLPLGWGFKTSTQNLKFYNYANLCTNLFKINEKCYFSISQRILILFVLSDRAWWGLRNFYTELWNSLIMQIYANLFMQNQCQNATSPLFRNHNRSALPAGTYITHRVIYYSLVYHMAQGSGEFSPRGKDNIFFSGLLSKPDRYMHWTQWENSNRPQNLIFPTVLFLWDTTPAFLCWICACIVMG